MLVRWLKPIYIISTYSISRYSTCDLKQIKESVCYLHGVVPSTIYQSTNNYYSVPGLSSKLGTKLPLPFSAEVRKSLITAWTGTVYGKCSLMLMPQGFTFAAPMALNGKATRFLWVQSGCLDTWFVLQEFCAHALWISLRNWLNTSIMSNGAFAVPSAWHE